MNLFEMLYTDNGLSLTCLVAIFFFVGGSMADETVGRWGWRAASAGYVGFVVYACLSVSPADAGDLAYIAYRGLYAGGLTVGSAWMTFAVVMFIVREFPEADSTSNEPATIPLPERLMLNFERGSVPLWKPKQRDFELLTLQEREQLAKRDNLIAHYERQARQVLEAIRRSVTPAAPAPDASQRTVLEAQLGELQLARQFVSVSGEDPQQLGRMLVECDAAIANLQQSLGLLPLPTMLEPAPILQGRTVFDEAIARTGGNPALYVERAKHQVFAERRANDAIGDCNHALDLLPRYYAAFNARGLAYLKLKMFAAATRDFQSAIFENPEFVYAYVNLARVYNATQRFRDAVGPAYYASFADPHGHDQLAFAYEQLGEHESAVHHLTAVIQSDPQVEIAPDARIRRAAQLRELGQIELAIYDLKTHLRQGPDASASAMLAELELAGAKSDGPEAVTANSMTAFTFAVTTADLENSP